MVYLKSGGDKNRPRELYVVHELMPEINTAVVRKSQAQLQARSHKVHLSELMLIKAISFKLRMRRGQENSSLWIVLIWNQKMLG